MNGCYTCGGFGGHHDLIAHGLPNDPCEHDWMSRGTDDDPWRECFLCGRVEDLP